MPKKIPSEDAAAPAVETPALDLSQAVEIPGFDSSKAVEKTPAYRHEPTARTVGFEQDLGDGRKALFSATRQFIAWEGEAPSEPINIGSHGGSPSQPAA